jgi:hypothetical protein
MAGDATVRMVLGLLIRQERLALCFPASSAQNTEEMEHPVLVLLDQINRTYS